jgi:hypothetical protein
MKPAEQKPQKIAIGGAGKKPIADQQDSSRGVTRQWTTQAAGLRAPFTLGVAPSGVRTSPASSPIDARQMRELCRERLPEPTSVGSAKAWVARGAARRLDG